MFHPLCGYSLQKGSRAIAIIDIVICILGISFRLIAYDYMEYNTYEAEIELDENALSWNGNGTLTPTVNITALASYLNNGNDLELDLDQYDESLNGYYLGLLITKLVVAFVIFVMYICIEVWLCRLLLRASKNRDSSATKTWFWWRLTVSIFFFVMSIVGIATLSHDWVDWTLEPLNIYRIYELIVVNEFRKEIVATSGRVKLRA